MHKVFNMFLKLIIAMFIISNMLSCSDNNDNIDQEPNVILIFTDDLGYGDLASYGNPTINTPNLDQLARDGVKYTQFYVTSPVCSPSRSSLLSGCYPKRIDLHKHVIFPQYRYGINPDEILLPELFKEAGYHTACYGKWHLGHQEPFLPLQNGFDEYYGIPFSNDMSRKEQILRGNKKYPHYLPLMEGNDTIELDPDQRLFTKNLTERTLGFINKHQSDRFFIYLAHPMVHIPLYVSDDFLNTSKRGLYGDAVEEIDWSTGQIVEVLKELDILDNTLIFFSSDNGPWLPFKTHGGSAGPLRGGKGSTWEGGMREPCIIKWPDNIKDAPAVDHRVWSSMDILPTLARICQLNLPDNQIDGIDLFEKLIQEDVLFPERPFIYYSSRGKIEGVRVGKWKYRQQKDTAFLMNIEEDISEQLNLIHQFPELADSMKMIMNNFDKKMDAEMRPHGKLN